MCERVLVVRKRYRHNRKELKKYIVGARVATAYIDLKQAKPILIPPITLIRMRQNDWTWHTVKKTARMEQKTTRTVTTNTFLTSNNIKRICTNFFSHFHSISFVLIWTGYPFSFFFRLHAFGFKMLFWFLHCCRRRMSNVLLFLLLLLLCVLCCFTMRSAYLYTPLSILFHFQWNAPWIFLSLVRTQILCVCMDSFCLFCILCLGWSRMNYIRFSTNISIFFVNSFLVNLLRKGSGGTYRRMHQNAYLPNIHAWFGDFNSFFRLVWPLNYYLVLSSFVFNFCLRSTRPSDENRAWSFKIMKTGSILIF